MASFTETSSIRFLKIWRLCTVHFTAMCHSMSSKLMDEQDIHKLLQMHTKKLKISNGHFQRSVMVMANLHPLMKACP